MDIKKNHSLDFTNKFNLPAAILLMSLFFLPALPALDNRTYDLPYLVRHAEIIVIGRVVQLTEISADAKDADSEHAVIATIAVKQMFHGAPVEQLKMIVRTQDESVVLVGHEFLFFLHSFDSSESLFLYPWLSGRNLVTSFGQFHFPHPIIPVEQNRIKFTDELIGSYFAGVINSVTYVHGLKDIFTLIRGPSMTITAPEVRLPWNKPWSVNLLFSNPSLFPIPLRASNVPGTPLNGLIVFTDQHGFMIGSEWCSLRLAGDEQQEPTVLLPAEEYLAGSITVHEPIPDLISDPEAIRQVYIIYYPLAETKELATGWEELIIGKADLRFINAHKKIDGTDTLVRSSSLLLPELSWSPAEDNSDAKDNRLEINVTANKYLIHDHRNGLHTISPDERSILIDALQWEQRGVVVRPARSGPALTAFITRLANEYYLINPVVTISELSPLVKPGDYNVRLILPHDNERALSNVIQVTIP
jgi:hypothetical protein